ncbi:MAG TPA: AI-2E family transporter [Bryobacteraceae bacterium]|nr:AI-2E family transporter [Bryobacteraceae bacterium]
MSTPAPRNPFRDSAYVLGRYVRAQLLIAVILMLLYGVGFGIAKVPLWPAIAVLGGLANFIPRIGSLVPLALAAVTIGWVDWNLERFLIAFAAWLVIQVLEGFFITPRLLSKPLGLRPLPVFVALLAGSFLFGPLGLFLAVPILAVAAVFYRYWQNRRNI